MSTTLYLNIGLDVAGRPDVDGSQHVKTVRLLSRIAGAGSYDYTAELGAPYTTADGRVTQETTIVAKVETTHDLRTVRRLIYRASVRLRQDCIAWSTDNGQRTGALTGPRASQYGDFNPAYFVPYRSEAK